jgi:hypothetical protein
MNEKLNGNVSNHYNGSTCSPNQAKHFQCIEYHSAKKQGKKRKSNMTKEVWEKGEEGAKILLEYVKNFGLYYGL